MIKTVILRHPKERLSKCSLEPLRGRVPELEFYKAKPGFFFDASGYTLLAVDAPVLSKADAQRPLLLPDSTWRLLPAVMAAVGGKPVARSLPTVPTAYPRVSKLAEDPQGGLASVEALYLAQKLLGHDHPELLDDYHWREEFLNILAQTGL